MNPTFGDRCFAAFQQVLPKHLLSRFIHALMRSRIGWLKRLLIGNFLKGYAVDMSEAAEPDPYAYPNFNAFFTRALRDGARPLDPDPAALVSPVDGTVSQFGTLDVDHILQAKGVTYTVTELLGGDAAWARRFDGGEFLCIYLAPYNYHRMHTPLEATVRRTVYVPGDLFSVNAATARTVARLFARNERVACDLATPAGSLAYVMVGALFVGSIETVWNGEINPPPRRRGAPVPLAAGLSSHHGRGAEIGRFNMGSTIVLLFEPGRVRWDPSLRPMSRVRLGERIGTLALSVA